MGVYVRGVAAGQKRVRSSPPPRAAMWSRGLEPGQAFDARTHAPALEQAIDAHSDKVPTSGRAFVPGCGRGYDLKFLASRGFDAVGLDVSTTAVRAARDYLGSHDLAPGSAKVVKADFFTYEPDDGGFDVIYGARAASPPGRRG